MTVPVKHHGSISLYGEWDDVRDYQFGVIYHPTGTSCDVLIMGGCDYGGGVSEVYDCLDAEKVEKIIHSYEQAPDDHSWECKEEIREFCKESQK